MLINKAETQSRKICELWEKSHNNRKCMLLKCHLWLPTLKLFLLNLEPKYGLQKVYKIESIDNIF